MTAAPHAADPIVWRPSAADIERSRLRRLYEGLGLASADELQARAAADPGWYWDAVVRDLGFAWSRPYAQALDLSRGKPWAEWFVGGGFNYVHNALDRWIAAGRGDRAALIWEGDDGATRRLTYRELAPRRTGSPRALRALGVGKGDRVGIFMPMLPETAIATLACSARSARSSCRSSPATARRRSPPACATPKRSC